MITYEWGRWQGLICNQWAEMDRGCGYWFMANETDFQKQRDVSHRSQIQDIAQHLKCASMETERTYWPSAMVTQRQKTQRGPGEDGDWANHMNCLQLTVVIWSPYILTIHTNHYCTALSHPIPFLLFPLKATPSFLWHNNLNMLSPERSLFSKLSLWQTAFSPCRSPRSSMYLTCPYRSISAPLCGSEKCISCV